MTSLDLLGYALAGPTQSGVSLHPCESTQACVKKSLAKD